MRKWTVLQWFSMVVIGAGLNISAASHCAYADPAPEECLGETMECTFTPELRALAQELTHDPARIYNWVYENIEYKWYLGSRLGAQSTFLARRGNEWDQCSLLITLLRISGTSARYVMMNDVNPDLQERMGCVYVEAFVPISNYRGTGPGEEKNWVPLAPWAKEYRVQPGMDLFPNDMIPTDLIFDFHEYMSTQKQKTPIEIFEEKLQEYLQSHHPGKSLSDISYKEVVIKKPASIMPGSLPDTVVTSHDETRFAEVPEKWRVSTTLRFRKADNTVLFEKTLPLCEFAGKRLCLDYKPASADDAKETASFGGMCKTPDGVARLTPVLKLDGVTIAEGSPLSTGEYLFLSYKTTCGLYYHTEFHDTSGQKAGSFVIMACDELAASEKTIEKLKMELKDITVNVVYSDQTREEYLGRIAHIYMTTCMIRMYEHLNRATDLLYCRRKYGESMTLIYTFPANLASDDSTKFLIHPSWTTDGMGLSDRVYKADDPSKFIQWNGPRHSLIGSLVGHTNSYNEGNIYEDWQDTEGFNTVKGIMVAHEQGVPILDINKDNLAQSVSSLQSQPSDVRIPQSTIDDYIIPKVNGGMSITMPARIITYEGLRGFVILGYRGGNFEGGLQYVLNDTDGGLSTDIPLSDHTWQPIGAYDPQYDWQSYVENTVDGDVDWRKENPEAQRQEMASAGDPVDLVTGEFYHEEKPDLLIKSRGFNLSLTRKYLSRVSFNGLFGHGWVWNHTEKIIPMKNGDLVYLNQDCLPYYLTSNGDGTYRYPAGTTFMVQKVGSAYVADHKSLHKYYFTQEGFLTRKEDNFGNFLSFGYDGSRRLIWVKDSLNRALTFTYNANGKVEQVTDFQGRYCRYGYDGDDLVSFTDLQGNTTRYEYLKNQDNPLCNHNMKKYNLPNGDYLQIAYYKNDTVAYHTNKKGETFNFQYSRLNRYGETWNEAGYYRKVFFNDTQDVIRVSNQDGTIETMEWDQDHNKISHTDGNGFKTTFTYDANRNMTSKKNALGEEWLYAYDLNFNKPLTVRDPKGNETRFEYHPNGALWKKVEAPDHAYDSEGRLVPSPGATGNVTTYGYDAFWNLTVVTDASSYSATTTYDAQGLYPVTTQDKNGHTTALNCDALGNLSSKWDPEGNRTEYEYNGYNQVKKIREHDGRETRYEYDVNRNLVRKIDPNGAVTETAYDTTRDLVAGAKIVKAVNPLGHFESYEYDEVGNMVLRRDKNGNRHRYVYDGMSRVVEEYDPYDFCTSYAYDGNGKLVSRWDKRENRSTFTYDKAGRKISMTDGEQNTWTFAYDPNGNLISETAPNNVITLYSYDVLNRLTGKTLSPGSSDQRVYQFCYDPLGRIVKAIQPLGNHEVYTYDGNGNKTRVESYDRYGVRLKEEGFAYDRRNLLTVHADARGKERNFEYDVLGRKTAEIDPSGRRTEFTYDLGGNLSRVIDKMGNITQHLYNLANQKVNTIDALNQVTSYLYDANGNLVCVTDPRGNEIVTYYDALNRKIGVQDAIGNTTTFDYDENGNLASWAKPGENAKYFSYDRSDRRVLESDSDSLYQTHYSYDSLGRIDEITDPRGIKTRIVYNDFGQQKEVREGFGTSDQALTSFTYDLNGNLTGLTNATNVKLNFVYDDLNRRVREQDPDGTYQELAYDRNGNAVLERKRDGSIIDRVYDDLNRLTMVSKDGQPLQTFQYDPLSRMTRAEDRNEGRQTHTVEYEYDPLHRLISEVQDGRSVEREFDPNGNVIALHYPSKRVVQKGYNGLNRPILIKDLAADIASLDWDADNRPALVALATQNQVEGAMAYDKRGLEWTREYTTNADAVLYSMTTLYDEAENIVRETVVQRQAAMVKDYTLDTLERLTREQTNSGARVWTYDKLGNWLSTSQNGCTETRKVNSSNEYTSIDCGSDRLTFHYDPNGNLTFDGTREYIYDWANRLVEVLENGHPVAQYTYDGLNRRVTKYVEETSLLTTYVYDSAQVIEEHESSVLARSYVYGPYVDDPLMMEDAQGTPYFYLKDRQYSVTALLNGAGQVVETYDYTAFGLMKIYDAAGQEIEASAAGNIHGYTGRQWDKESGLWYYRNRMYSAKLGRFLQRDPAGYVDGVNLYTYVKNNPLRYLDPHGFRAQDSHPVYPHSEIKTNTSDLSYEVPGLVSVFDPNFGVLIVYNPNNTSVMATYSAGNRTTNPGGNPSAINSRAPAPPGTFPVQAPVNTQGRPEYGPYFWPIGAVGQTGERLDVARQRGIGIHGGRRGPQSPTYGCIRLSDGDIIDLYGLTRRNPLSQITILERNPVYP